MEKGKEVPNTYFRPSGELGKYKSFERALEVLDEIQNILKPQTLLKYEPDDNLPIMNGEWEQSFKIKECSDIVKLDTYVYEMPKD